MNVILRMLCGISLFFALNLVAAALPESKENMPYFMVLSYDETFKNKSQSLIHNLVTHDLAAKLDFKPAGIEHVAEDEALRMISNFESKLEQNENIAPFKIAFSRLSREYYPEYGRGSSPVDIVATMKRADRPVIIICDTYGSAALQKILASAAPDSVHSVILFDPEVNQPLNYNAISHRIYNFYSKNVKGRTTRKYSPRDNGFDANKPWSKIVNIRCVKEDSLAGDVDLSFDLANIQEMNVPALIRFADLYYKINWDLVAITQKASTTKSKYENIRMPLLFINRSLQIIDDVITNPTENWSQKLPAALLPRIARQLDNEEAHHSQVTEFLFADSSRQSKAVQEIPSIAEKVGRGTQGTAFFVPGSLHGAEGAYLVVFARSVNPKDLLQQNFSAMIGQQQKAFPFFVVLGKNAPSKVSQAILSVPLLKNYASNFSENDPNYYAIAKLFIPNNELEALRGSSFTVLFKNKPLKNSNEHENKGSMPIMMNYSQHNVDFIAYADVQKQSQSYELSKKESGSAIYPLAAIIKENELAEMKRAGGHALNSLHLVVGDLVRNSKNFNSWMEVLTKLTEMVSNNQLGLHSPFSLLATAIGTHDFADVDKGLLTFYNMIPTYAYLFDGPFEPEPMLYSPQYHVEKTNLWFDISRVRFIHLPYTTEEEITPMPDGFSNPTAFIERVVGQIKSLGYGFEFDPYAIIGQFKRDLDLAIQARNQNKIDFIIVYGHAPLATAPQFNHLHPGLLHSFINGQIATPNKLRFAKELLPALANAHVDLYLSGHNHQYDHCVISYNYVNPAGKPAEWRLHAVTIGLGTELRHATSNGRPPLLSTSDGTLSIKSARFLSGSDAEQYKEYFENKFLPAYLKCQVRGTTLTCTLIGKGGILRERSGEPFDTFDIISA